MAKRAQVGDKRKRKDGHYWEKLGSGKWKRLAKKKEDGDDPGDAAAKKERDLEKSPSYRKRMAAHELGPEPTKEEMAAAKEEDRRWVEEAAEKERGEKAAQAEENRATLERWRSEGMTPEVEAERRRFFPSVFEGEPPPTKEKKKPKGDDPAIEAAAKKDGPGKRDLGDLNPGDRVEVDGREYEVVGVTKEGELIASEPGARGEQAIPLNPGEKVERTYQKETNVERAQKEDVHREFNEKVRAWVNRGDAWEAAGEESEGARESRTKRREAKRGKGTIPKSTQRSPGWQRGKHIDKKIEEQLLSGRGTVEPFGDTGPKEVAARLKMMKNRGLVRELPDGNFELTAAGIAGRQRRQEGQMTRAGGTWRTRKKMSDEELKRKKREWAERYREKQGAEPKEAPPTTEAELGAMVSQAQASLERRRAKRKKK